MTYELEQKVSIIIPFYNTMDYFEDCLSTVLAQTHENIEIIIVNDASNHEETLFLESLLSDERIIYLKNDMKKGVAFSRNRGLTTASGQYVFFLDSDDMLIPDTIEVLLENIGEYPAIFGKTKRLLRPSDLEPVISLKDTVNSELTRGTDLREEIHEMTESNSILAERNSLTLFRSGSVLNILFSNEFIKKTNLQFYEETEGYSDLQGILPIIMHSEKLPSLKKRTYYKRVRNDPITNPSISQRAVEQKTFDFIKVYTDLNDQFGQVEKAKLYLDRQLLRFFRRNVSRIFNDEDRFDDLFNKFSAAVGLLNPTIIKSQPLHIRRELVNLKKGNKEKFKKALKFHVEALDFKNAIKGFTRLKRYIYKKVFLKRPIKDNYIVFESFLGKNYSDSPRNIYEYIIENDLNYKCIWVFNDKNRKIPGNAKVVKRFSLAYYYYFAVSKYWVNNMRQPLHLVKREGNVFLETWHGTPLKKLVFDMKDVYSANPRYKKDFYLQSRAWDYLLSPNRYSSEVFKSAFKFDKEMLEYGYPRNDILYSPDREALASKIKESIGIPKDKKVVLYAPTWRDDDFYEPGKYKFDLKLDLSEMRKRLGDEYVIALRMHYFIADDLNIEGLDGFAFNLSKYDDIAHLYLISDILITDYSSVFFDYANLKRPILFYTYDLEKYRDQLRGFYIDFEKDAPGPLLKTSDDVIKAIENSDQIMNEYAVSYANFYDKFCSWHDGKSTERVVKKVFRDR